VRAARGAYVILHDNDILVPARYAAEVVARGAEGFDFLDLERFLFHLDARGELASIMQNAQGGSIAARRDAYLDIGGFDDTFVGWGGEDNDFWDRAETTGKAYHFGYLPMIHLHHPPQKGKLDGAAAPAVQRYRELERVPAEERIRRLRERYHF
jgi:GT2 family glycosyltransferase